MSLEGVIGKRSGSLYVSRRSADWIKLKCRMRQEFVIVGYTQPQGCLLYTSSPWWRTLCTLPGWA